jgi:hypothetical protein
MIHRASVFFFIFVLPAPTVLSQQGSPAPAIAGYVTRGDSRTDFDANGFHVIPGETTTFMVAEIGKEKRNTNADPYFGQSVTVYGHLHKQKHVVIADEVIFHPPDMTTLSGFAVVDRILTSTKPASGSPELLVRADGYMILINATTKTGFKAPLVSLSDVATNVWIKYHGKPQSNGVLLADTASFISNSVLDHEAKLLEKDAYDPKTVDADSKQSAPSKVIHGRDAKQIPPYKDAALQTRIDRIGASLVPAYQRNLPDGDPTKITFRFQLIDDPKMKEGFAVPNGTILIPFQTVNHLQSDSQLATILADNIARVLEKQTFRAQSGHKKMIAAEVASGVLTGYYIFGTATVITASVAHEDKRNAEDQSGRVSLGLLHDAGYDIDQAPIAWWLLATDSAEILPSSPLPSRAANLYKSLGSTWRNYPEASASSSAGPQTK